MGELLARLSLEDHFAEYVNRSDSKVDCLPMSVCLLAII